MPFAFLHDREKYPRDVGTCRSKGALCVLWHSEDVLICLSGELSAKFLNNNGELVEKEREGGVIGRKRERERKEERKIDRKSERDNEREPRGSAISRS